jgi:hypothetical protein
MKHIKGINEGMPFFTTFSGPVTFMNAVKIYDKNDFFKFDKEVIKECGKLKKKYQGPDAKAYFDSLVSNSPVLVIDMDENRKLIINYNQETQNYDIVEEEYGWGSGW